MGVQASLDICNMVVNRGYGGIMLWCMQAKGNVPADLAAVTPYVGSGTTAISLENQSHPSSSMSLSARYNWVTGTSEIRYALPSAIDRRNIELGIFDMQGSLIRNLIDGPAPTHTGVLTFPLAQTNATGTYIVKMSSGNSAQTTKLTFTR